MAAMHTKMTPKTKCKRQPRCGTDVIPWRPDTARQRVEHARARAPPMVSRHWRLDTSSRAAGGKGPRPFCQIWTAHAYAYAGPPRRCVPPPVLYVQRDLPSLPCASCSHLTVRHVHPRPTALRDAPSPLRLLRHARKGGGCPCRSLDLVDVGLCPCLRLGRLRLGRARRAPEHLVELLVLDAA